MAKIGVKKLVAFPLTTDTDTETTYGTAVRLAPLIKLELTPNTVEGSLYGDDDVVYSNFGMTGYKITIDTADLMPEHVNLLLGHKKDTANGITVNSNDEGQAVGLAFESKRADGNTEYVVLYKVKFSPSSESYETKGENITYQTPQLTGTALPRKKDGDIKYTVIAKTAPESWYTTPQSAPAQGVGG